MGRQAPINHLKLVMPNLKGETSLLGLPPRKSECLCDTQRDVSLSFHVKQERTQAKDENTLEETIEGG